MYWSFLEGCLTLFKADTGVIGTSKDRHLLRVFAVTNFVLERLSRGLFLFSSRRYSDILKAIARAVVNVIRILEDSVKTAFEASQIDFKLIVNSTLSTTVQAELDGCFVRAVSILLNRTRAGSWEYLTTLPCDILSDHMKFFLVNSILNGEPLSLRNLRRQMESTHDLCNFEESNPSGVAKMIASNDIEAKYLLSFLVRICTSGADSGYQSRLKEIIAKVVFYFGFLDVEYRDPLHFESCELLSTLCHTQPSLISLVVSWTRKHFAVMGHLSISLFQKLPLTLWCPNTPDFDGFIAMLRDSFKSDKFELAKVVLGGLNWGLKHQSTDLFIPRPFHRFLALSLCNLYLDRVAKVPMFSVSSALSTTAKLRKGELSGLLPTINSGETEFYDWCWNLVVGLSLYQQPTSLNTYALDSNAVMRNKPFEVLESAQLATLRGVMKTKSLAAFTLLMISDVGHSIAAFERDGWSMMQLLLDEGRYEAVTCVVNELFLAFAFTEGFEFTGTKSFTTFFTSFLKACPRSLFSPSKLGLNFGHSNTVATVQWFLLWSRVAFADTDWIHNRTCLQLLDSLAQISVINDQYHILTNEFQREYARLIALYQRFTSHSMSFLNPVESLYTVANTIGEYLSSYPTLVTGVSSEWYSSIPSSMRGNQPAAETEFVWFAFLALIAETQVESEMRMQIGHELSKDSQVSVNGVVKKLPKPLSLFSIYRLATQIVECKVYHSLLPLMLQVFFSLYFERAQNPAVNMNALFGFRFFSDSRSTLDKIQMKLSQTIQELSSSDSMDLSVFDRERLIKLYKASFKWIKEPVLLSPNLYLGHLDASFSPSELATVMNQSPCTLNELWPGYVSIDLFKNLFQPGDKTPHQPSVPSLSKTNSPGFDLYVKETSLPGIPWVLRPTVILSSSQTTLEVATKILKDDYASLLTKARDSSKIDVDYSKHDSEFIALLSQLYTNATKTGRYERKCGGSCTGAAQFRYTYEEVGLQRNIKQALKENRSHFETLSEWDNVDSRVCIGALRVVRIIEWMKHCEESGQGDKEKLEALFVPFFFKMVCLDESIRRYPPFVMILDRAVQLIGGLFVRGSRSHTMKMFEVIQRGGGDMKAVIDAFNPAVAVDEFCEMYAECSEQANVSTALLQKFDVVGWLNQCDSETQDNMFRVLCTIFERIESGKLTASREVFNSHLTKLDEFMSHPSLGNRLVGYIMHLISFYSEGTISKEVIISVRKTINSKLDFSVEQVTGFELFELHLSRSQSMDLLKRLNDCLGAFFVNYATGIYGFDHEKLQFVLELLVMIYCSKPLYSMLSETDRLEVISQFRRSCWLSLGADVAEDAGSLTLKPWCFQDDDNFAQALSSLLFCSYSKVFRSLAMVDNMVFELWSTLSSVVRLNAPSYVVTTLYARSKIIPWTSFIATSSVADEIWEWKEQGVWGVEVQQFVASILSSCQWPPNADVRLLYLIYLLISNADILWPVSAERVSFFNLVVNKSRPSTSTIYLTCDHLFKLVSLLPRKWPNSRCKSVLNFDTDSSFGFCIINLRYLIDSAMRELDYEERVKILNGYLFELLTVQLTTTGSNSSLNDVGTFDFAKVPSIIAEMTGRVDTRPLVSQGLLAHSLTGLFSVVNTADRTNFPKIWDGITLSLQQSPNPLVWISLSCKQLASTEVMAILTEKAIARYIGSSTSWTAVTAVLQVPQLDSEGFTSNCLHHGLTFTLYTIALQQLHKISSSKDLQQQRSQRTTLGEQISLWILKLNHSSLPLHDPQEKLLPLLDLFAQLLSQELQSLHDLPRHHSRLYSLVPSLAEVILKWSEPANAGLWTSLGLTPKIQFPPAFRVFCKGYATFLAMNLTGALENDEDGVQREQFLGRVSVLKTSREYEEVGGYIDVCLDVLKEGKGLESGWEVARRMAGFSDIVRRGVLVMII
ncbi:hypothetical protein BCR33DRAFT_40087 [Rhizoclosmatium globosum]|uniref:Epg5-like TPR domain-containing protein n=1 Tax=Rhizoclosmatium globosum TaxID=329046 RepID=A0A1Y2CNJ6_9FUNG|nr:hypothetical protein BCR33DRAFT_40087 [Rhizoclosmatium globosum]|eukprot:ORY48609.1 hypothetical protein BCR33DRAFT_40087 [Rhizoclosmatium globosum]